MNRTIPAMPAVAYAAAVVAWIACFRLLVQYGTWLPFAVAGPLLAAFSFAAEPAARALVRPTLPRAVTGIAAGTVMIAGTYLGFAVLRWILPSIDGYTQSLYALLRTGDFSDLQRAALIVVVASSEEVLFRGTVFGGVPSNPALRFARGLDRAALARVAFFAGLYATTAAASGSPLLVLVALIGGLYWGLLRVASGSVFAPILAHVVWDLSILVLRPLL